MFSKFMPLALYTVPFVQAMPFSFTSDVSCVSNNYEVRSPLYVSTSSIGFNPCFQVGN